MVVSLLSLPRMPERSGVEELEVIVEDELEQKGFLPFTVELFLLEGDEDAEDEDVAGFELEDKEEED
jgi:hypothetical protein